MKVCVLICTLAFALLIFTGCATTDTNCAGCKNAQDSCTCKAETTVCSGCTDLAAGGTGWCAECGKGFFEGKEVNCKGGCKANPGGPPCSACVK